MPSTYHAVVEYVNTFEFQYGRTPIDTWEFAIGCSIAYLVVISLLEYYMKNREKWTLEYFSLVHNLNMVVISVVCFFGLLQGSVYAYEVEF